MSEIRRIPHIHYYLEPKDGIAYNYCQLRGHVHYIPLRFRTCLEAGAWTWESRYMPDQEDENMLKQEQLVWILKKYGLSEENAVFVAEYAKETGYAEWSGYAFRVRYNKSLGRFILT